MLYLQCIVFICSLGYLITYTHQTPEFKVIESSLLNVEMDLECTDYSGCYSS